MLTSSVKKWLRAWIEPKKTLKCFNKMLSHKDIPGNSSSSSKTLNSEKPRCSFGVKTWRFKDWKDRKEVSVKKSNVWRGLKIWSLVSQGFHQLASKTWIHTIKFEMLNHLLFTKHLWILRIRIKVETIWSKRLRSLNKDRKQPIFAYMTELVRRLELRCIKLLNSEKKRFCKIRLKVNKCLQRSFRWRNFARLKRMLNVTVNRRTFLLMTYLPNITFD